MQFNLSFALCIEIERRDFVEINPNECVKIQWNQYKKQRQQFRRMRNKNETHNFQLTQCVNQLNGETVENSVCMYFSRNKRQ